MKNISFISNSEAATLRGMFCYQICGISKTSSEVKRTFTHGRQLSRLIDLRAGRTITLSTVEDPHGNRQNCQTGYVTFS